jgi:hypothetical protein
MWYNFNIDTHSLTKRPEPVGGSATDVAAGLAFFPDPVERSIGRVGMWNVCEWAIVSCNRGTDGDGDC